MNDKRIIALYLLLCASRRGSNTIILGNDCLKQLLPRQRVHYRPLMQLARSFGPVFKTHLVGKEYYGVKTNLTLSSAQDDPHKTKEVVRINSLPTLESMKSELGLA